MSKKLPALACLLVLGIASQARATTWTGNLFYTYSNGGQNVDSVTYSYNDVSHSFTTGAINGIASLGGADGIIFDSNGHLLVG